MRTRVITSDNYPAFLEELKSLSEEKYRDFQNKLVPGEGQPEILGIRMPVLRAIAKEIGRGEPRQFLTVCGDDYYEERMLRALVAAGVKPENFEELQALADGMLPYVSNWAVCDCFCMELKSVKRFRKPFFEHIAGYLSGGVWEQRVGLVLMLSHYLDDEYIDRCSRRRSSSAPSRRWLITRTIRSTLPRRTRRSKRRARATALTTRPRHI